MRVAVRRLTSFLIVALLFWISSPVMAQEVEYVASILWKDARDIDVDDNYSYCILRNGLLILDVSDPSFPRYVSQTYLEGGGHDIFLRGNYAYVTHGSTFQIIDISDPTSPVFVGNNDMIYRPHDVFILGDYAYVADFLSGLKILDISDPLNPTIVGSYISSFFVSGVYVVDDYVYLTSTWQEHLYFYYFRLQILDVSNPAEPILVGSYEGGGKAYDVFVSGDYAYVSGGDSPLKVFDISVPSNPTYVGSFHIGGVDVSVVGSYAFVCAGVTGFFIIDVNDPSNPTLVGAYDTPGSAERASISGSYTYIADGRLGGIEIANIGEPTSPTHAGSYEVPDFVCDVFALDEHAYVADDDSGLIIIDISNPASPSIAGSFPTEMAALRVFTSGNYAYVAGPRQILAIDVSDPYSPALAGSLGDSVVLSSAPSYFVSHPYLYLANGDPGLQIFDFSEPSEPTCVGSYNTPGLATYVHVDGEYAYVIDHYQFEYDLYIVDVSDPANPIGVGTYVSAAGNKVFAQGNYAYIVNEYSASLHIIDVSDPSNPLFIGSYYYEFHGGARDLFVSGAYVYVAFFSNDETGVRIIDVNDPYSPILAGSYNTPGSLNRIHVLNDYIYLSEFYSLMILSFFQTVVVEEPMGHPSEFALSQNYPNPFNASTTIRYNLHKPSDATIDIYDILGRKVRTLVNGKQPAGYHQAVWNARDISSGMYFYKIQAGDYIETKKMVLLK